MINVNELKPVTVRKINKAKGDKDIYETIEDGYEWDSIFISKEFGILTEWFLNDLRKFNKIENYAEVLPRNADNLHVFIKEHDVILNEDWFYITEDNNPENTAIKLYTYRVSITFEHSDGKYIFSVVTHKNQTRKYESNEKAIEDIERWINVRLNKYSVKATYFISRKDNGFEKRGQLKYNEGGINK